MLLILEIILTIVAWNRGWKAWALLPLVVPVALGFVIGMIVGAQGGSMEDIMPIALVLDGVSVVSLIALAARGRQEVPTHKEKPTAPVMDVPTVEPTLKQAMDGSGHVHATVK